MHLIFEFTGPPGVAYPQHQPTMDSFDDSQRKNKSAVERAEKEKQDREDAAEAARKAAEDVGGIPQGARERFVNNDFRHCRWCSMSVTNVVIALDRMNFQTRKF